MQGVFFGHVHGVRVRVRGAEGAAVAAAVAVRVGRHVGVGARDDVLRGAGVPAVAFAQVQDQKESAGGQEQDADDGGDSDGGDEAWC